MKKIARTIIEALLICATIFVLVGQADPVFVSASSIPLDDTAFKASGVPVPPEGKSGQEIVELLVFSGLNYVKVIMVVIAIIYITIVAYRLITMSDNEEEVKTAKTSLTYIIIGLAAISMSQDIARIFDMRDNSILGSPQSILQRVKLFDRQVELIIKFIKVIIGTYAVLMIVRSAGILIMYGGEEEDVTNEKKSILYAILGLILINVGDIAINRVFYRIDKDIYSGIQGVNPGIDAAAGVEQIAGVTNLVVSFLGPIAVVMLIIGAFIYLTAGGDEEKMGKAKRLIVSTVIGIVIIFGAFAIVSTIISGRLAAVGALTQEN